MVEVAGEFSYVDGEVQGSTSGGKVGTGFVNASGDRSLQATLNTFAFIWTGPYTTWAEFETEALNQWDVYRASSATDAVLRLGVRYINRVPLPDKSIEIRDYLRTSIDVAPSLPQVISNFFMQVELPLPESLCPAAVATITSSVARDPRTGEGPHGLLLDIDVSSTTDFDARDPAFMASIQDRLASMRSAKNYIFESCITDATRGLIQ